MIPRLLTATTLTFTGLMLLAAPLSAQTTMRINAGYWPGELTPEMESRMEKDDLIQGNGFGRLNQPWTGKHTHTIYPAGLEFLINAGPGRVVLGGNYIRYQPEYSFDGIGLVYLSDVDITNYKTTDWEFKAGYEYPVIPGRLFVTPRMGYRQHFKEFVYNEFTIGANPVVLLSDSSVFDGAAKGMYMGLDIQFYVMDQLSIVGDVMFSTGLPGWSGYMSYSRTVYGVASSPPSPFSGAAPPTYSLERGEAGYEIDIFRWSLGVQYDVTEELSVSTGFRQEQLAQRYPEYFAIPIIIRGNSLPSGSELLDNTLVELLTDRIFYGSEETQIKGLWYMALSYDVDL